MFWGLALLLLAVFVHEMGHWVVARFFGWVAPTFSVGFGPKVASVRWRGTQWQIAWLPLGGYVELPQLSRGVEMSSDPSEPLVSYRDPVGPDGAVLRPAGGFERLVVAIAGPAANVALAVVVGVVFLVVLAVGGWSGMRAHASMESREVGYVVEEILEYDEDAPRLVPGDEVLALDGEPLDSVGELASTRVPEIGDGRTTSIRVLRGGETVEVALAAIPGVARGCPVPGLPAESVVVSNAPAGPGTLAEVAGLVRGERVVAVDGEPVRCPAGMYAQLAVRCGRVAAITVEGVDGVREVAWAVPPEARAMWEGLGFTCATEWVEKRWEGFGAATPGQVLYALEQCSAGTTGASRDGPMGPVGIMLMFDREGDSWLGALSLFAVLNLALAIFNLFPIPPLDGARAVGGVVEMVAGRPPPALLKLLTDRFAAGFVVTLLAMILLSDASFLASKGVEQVAGKEARDEAPRVDDDALGRAMRRAADLRWADARVRGEPVGEEGEPVEVEP